MNELDARYAEAAFAARNPEFHEAEKQTLLEQAQSFAKAVGTITTGIAASAPAGIAGMATLPFKGVEGAKQVIEDITQALTYVPQDEAGQAMVQRIAGALKMLGEPAQWVGDKVNDLTGSPAAATAAEIIHDPVNLATAGAAAAIKPAAKVAGRVAKKVAENAAAIATKAEPDIRGVKVYHGTDKEFDSFDGGMFTSNRGRAENYAMGSSGRVIEATLDIRNPMPWAEAFGKSPAEIKSAGFDGTVQWGKDGEVMRAVVVDPSQVLPTKKVGAGKTATEGHNAK